VQTSNHREAFVGPLGAATGHRRRWRAGGRAESLQARDDRSFLCGATTRTIVGLLLLSGAAAVRGQDLTERCRAVVAASPAAGGRCGLFAVDLHDGKVVVDLDGDRRLAPASVTKLFSGAAALVTFGEGHRFTTTVRAIGGVDADGAVGGSLVLVAAGDPNLSGRRMGTGELAIPARDHFFATYGDGGEASGIDPCEGLADLAAQVHAAGVRWCREVVVDDRLFGSPAEAAGISPIMINDNLIDLLVRPAAAAGSYASCLARPTYARLLLDVRVNTTASGAPRVGVQSLGNDRFLLLGQVAAASPPLLRVARVTDPASFARSLFVDLLRARGIRGPCSPLADNPRADLPSVAALAAAPIVATRESAPFAEALRVVFKLSQNDHAEMLLHSMAAAAGEHGVAAGLRRQRDILVELGVPAAEATFGSASGGDSADSVTPRATVALLRAMAARPEAAAFLDALPVLGVDGTLRDTVDAAHPARGRVQAKSGTLVFADAGGGVALRSKALAGYVTTRSERRIAFAFFLNDLHVEGPDGVVAAGRLLAHLCELIVLDDPPASRAR